MSQYDDDRPCLTYVRAECTLEIVSDSLRHGENWENKDKRETAADYLVESKFTFETSRRNSEEKSVFLPFNHSSHRNIQK